MKVYYRHFRIFKNGNLLPWGGVTLRVEEEKGVLNTKVYYASCSMKDHYCKAFGRFKADHRATSLNQPHFKVSEANYDLLKQMAYEVAPPQLKKIFAHERQDKYVLDLIKRNV